MSECKIGLKTIKFLIALIAAINFLIPVQSRFNARCKVQRLSAVSCAKTAEPIEMQFGTLSRVGHTVQGTCITWGCIDDLTGRG